MNERLRATIRANDSGHGKARKFEEQLGPAIVRCEINQVGLTGIGPRNARDIRRVPFGIGQENFKAVVGKISLGELGDLLGIGTSAALDWLSRHGIPINYAATDFEADCKTLSNLLGNHRK